MTDYIFAVRQEDDIVILGKYGLHTNSEVAFWGRRFMREYPGAEIWYRKADGEYAKCKPGQILVSETDGAWFKFSPASRFVGV